MGESGPRPGARKHPRVAFPAEVEFAGSEFRLSEFTSNLSEGGIFLVTERPVATGTTGELTLSVSIWEDPLNAVGEVVRVLPPASLDWWPPGLGIRFLKIDDPARTELRNIVDGVRDGSMVKRVRRSILTGQRALELELARASRESKMILALHAQGKEIGALIRDRDPWVLERLIENPQLTLPHVRAILRDSRMAPRLLQAVATKKQWIADDEVRYLFCKHPASPTDRALPLVEQLDPAQLRKLLTNVSLQPEVRERIKALLAKSK